MADVSAGPLLLRLTDAIFRKAITPRIGFEVRVLEGHLQLIQSLFMMKVDKDNVHAQNWVKEVGRVLSEIDDAMDIFLIKVESESQKEPGVVNTLKRLAKKRMKRLAIYKLDVAISTFKDRLWELKVRRPSLGGSCERPPVNSESDERDLVGFDDEKNKIIELLHEKDTSKLSVISIVGLSGLGKTVLAKEIYQSAYVKEPFDVRVWLTVSREYDIATLLKELLENVVQEAGKEVIKYEIVSTTEKVIKELLDKKRYFIVLDDVWTKDLWVGIQSALPDNGRGNRVLITTRFRSVAKHVEGRTCDIRFLKEEESLKLLLRKASAEDCPPKLIELAKNLSKQCVGLPLALIEAGGLLSKCPKTENDWNQVIKTMDINSKCMEILAGSSYNYLPVQLKACFMYFSSFPKNYEHKAKFLIRLWDGEGFIQHGERYLEDLAERCVIQVSKRSISDDSIECFHVDCRLHDLAIHEAKEKNYFQIIAKQEDFQSGVARRAVFKLDDSCWETTSFEGKKLIEYTKWNIRSLIFYGKVLPFDSQFTLLRVLVVNGYTCPDDRNPNWGNCLKMLFYLRCLVFRKCLFKHFVLPGDLSRNLQTLDIMSSQGIEVPISIWDIKALRHVLVNNETEIPMGSRADLPNLQTLKKATIDKPGIELLNMPRLCELHLYNQSVSWDPIIISLKNARSLKTLTLEASRIPLEIIDTKKFPSYQHLQTLYLNGVWQPKSGAIKAGMFPQKLISLTLVNSQIDQHVMLELGNLSRLRLLKLFGAYNGKELICYVGRFPRLETLELSWIYKLEEWIIKEGAMPRLTDLKIFYCKKLGMLPDLQHVPNLKVLTLGCMLKEFNSRLENEDQHKIKHIPSITTI